MLKKMWKLSLVVSVGCFFLSGCFPKIVAYKTDETFISPTGVPDYTSLDYWAAHPDKWDPSDSIQKKLAPIDPNKEVGVFFLYPTSLTDGDIESGTPMNARIDDPYLNKKTDYTSILYQASVFNQHCDVYAPRYRQAHISMYYNKDTALVKKAFDLAYADVKKAFFEFLDMNHGRPFIIGSHSQGTTHATRLVAEVLDSDTLRERMITAYLIGMPVPKNSFKNIKVCTDTARTGCFVSWRTFQDGYLNPYISWSDSSIAVVNPILWGTDTSRSIRKQHMGAILYNYQKLYKHTHEAQVRGNALYISKPRFPGSFLVRMENYHAGDYNLFYVNIRDDISRRIRAYMKERN